MSGQPRHILVVYDGTAAARRALLDGGALAGEHEAEISVVTQVAHDHSYANWVCCGVSRTYWNRMMDELAENDLATACAILGEREPKPRFSIVSGHGPAAIQGAARELDCDLVLFPVHGLLRRHYVRRLRRAVAAELFPVRSH